MRFSTLFTFVATAVLTSAGPIRVTRQAPPVDPGLAFLTIVELGATAFYEGLIQTFNASDFQNSGFANGQAVFDILSTITNSEATHLALLESESGAAPPNCTLDFSPAYADPITGIATARVLELAAIGGYIGVIGSETVAGNLESFAETMGNEARHEALLSMLLGGDPFPDSFELALTPAEILTLLLPFKPSCTPALTLTPNTPLTVTNTGPITNTTTLTFDLSNTSCANQTGLFCQLLTGDDASAAALPLANCTLEGTSGGILAYVTTDGTPISADPLQRGNLTNLCAGPAVTFVDPAVIPPLDALLLQPVPSTAANSTTASNSTA